MQRVACNQLKFHIRERLAHCILYLFRVKWCNMAKLFVLLICNICDLWYIQYTLSSSHNFSVEEKVGKLNSYREQVIGWMPQESVFNCQQGKETSLLPKLWRPATSPMDTGGFAGGKVDSMWGWPLTSM